MFGRCAGASFGKLMLNCVRVFFVDELWYEFWDAFWLDFGIDFGAKFGASFE